MSSIRRVKDTLNEEPRSVNAKEKQRYDINKQIEEFFAKGGVIQEVDSTQRAQEFHLKGFNSEAVK